MTSLQKDVGDALHIGDIDKPATEAPAATPAIEPPATSSDAPTTSSDALASSEAPVNPTTPEPPPQTIVEAEAHAVTEPINLAPPAAEALKDAKAS
jgi:sec-independent protein translocase protein TatB